MCTLPIPASWQAVDTRYLLTPETFPNCHDLARATLRMASLVAARRDLCVALALAAWENKGLITAAGRRVTFATLALGASAGLLSVRRPALAAAQAHLGL